MFKITSNNEIKIKLFPFCYLIWLTTALFYFDIITFNPLLLSIIALFFTIMINIFNPYNLYFSKLFFIIVFEAAIVAINVYKTRVIKDNFVSGKNILFSSIIFTLYLLFLEIKGTDFYKFYSKTLLKFHENKTNLDIFKKMFK
tara:strand:+ start:351 stop:779 length:429 start_codon:yes stop_codon:yes gene_type:complete